jgi:hypothetical protein
VTTKQPGVLLPYFAERLLSNPASIFLTPVPLHTPGREMKEGTLELESESDLWLSNLGTSINLKQMGLAETIGCW